MYLLTPPTRTERTGVPGRLFGRMNITIGVSLLKESGLYRQVESPTAEEVVAADAAYLGGHEYEVSDAEAADLTDAGYAAWLTKLPNPYGSGFYGVGVYGTGIYGA